jgi:hypothetical protein
VLQNVPIEYSLGTLAARVGKRRLKSGCSTAR